MKIGSISFGTEVTCHGLSLVVHEAVARGYDVEPVKSTFVAKDFDVLLVSLYWWEHIYDYARFIGQSGIDPQTRKPILIVGGQNACLNPLPFSPALHYAVAVDGEAVIGDLLDAIARGDDQPDLDGVWWPGRPGPVDSVSADRVWANSYIQEIGHGDIFGKSKGKVHTFKPITSIEIARGCDQRCAFCSLSHLKGYREVPAEEIAIDLKQCKTKTVKLIAADRSTHSEFSRIERMQDEYGVHDTACDIRAERIFDVERIGNLQFGIEGLSERLRKAVGKPMTAERIAECVERMHKTPSLRSETHGSVLSYLIGGLPGETGWDYEQFGLVMDALSGRVDPRFAWVVVLNWFIPQPFTPLQFGRVDMGVKERNQMWHDLAHGRNRYRYKYRVNQKGTMALPQRQLQALLALRGVEKHWPVIYGIANKTAVRKKTKTLAGMTKLLSMVGTTVGDLADELPTKGLLPWEKVWTHARGRPKYTRRRWGSYKKILDRMGPDAEGTSQLEPGAK